MAAEINGIKPQFSLMDHNFINMMTFLMTDNQKKHADHHYQDHKLDAKYFSDKIWRHLVDLCNGVLDEESGLHPAVHIGCLAMMAYSQIEIGNSDKLAVVREAIESMVKECDDRMVWLDSETDYSVCIGRRFKSEVGVIEVIDIMNGDIGCCTCALHNTKCGDIKCSGIYFKKVGE